jgi:hypothetical protein
MHCQRVRVNRRAHVRIATLLDLTCRASTAVALPAGSMPPYASPAATPTCEREETRLRGVETRSSLG